MNRNLMVAAITAALFALGTTAGSAAFAQQAAKLAGGGVRIGVMTDMSGLYSDLAGQGSVVAAQMAIDDFVAANKPGYKIDVVSADHQNKADVGANKAREWFDTQNVDMITELLNSAVALAVAKVSNDKKKLSMVSGAATSRLTAARTGDISVCDLKPANSPTALLIRSPHLPSRNSQTYCTIHLRPAWCSEGFLK